MIEFLQQVSRIFWRDFQSPWVVLAQPLDQCARSTFDIFVPCWQIPTEEVSFEKIPNPVLAKETTMLQGDKSIP